MEDGLNQVHQKEQMLQVLLSRFSAKTIIIVVFIWKAKCNTQPQVKKQERWLVVNQMKQLSEVTGEKILLKMKGLKKNERTFNKFLWVKGSLPNTDS